ncbi:MAG: OB-fold protein [Bacteroidia bacterium]|jgi:hypothetical protein
MKKNNLVRIILIVLLIALLSGSITVYMLWNKEHADATEEKGIDISAAALYKAFKTDSATANKKYLGKVIEVSGTVSEVINDEVPRYVLSVPDEMLEGVIISQDARYRDSFKGLKVGDSAQFKGFCVGYLEMSGITIKDASRIKP